MTIGIIASNGIEIPVAREGVDLKAWRDWLDREDKSGDIWGEDLNDEYYNSEDFLCDVVFDLEQTRWERDFALSLLRDVEYIKSVARGLDDVEAGRVAPLNEFLEVWDK